MYSPINNINNNVRINPNKNKYIIRGRRKLKSNNNTFSKEIQDYKASDSK